MSMSEWAKKEVELACKKERGDNLEDGWDYGCACYESALKAYESLCDDGHSGMSWGFTKNILIRLMNSLPLTPITGDDDEWNKIGDGHYQNKRMSSLFKEVYPNGDVKYCDIDRAYGIDDRGFTFGAKVVNDIVDELFPITMPYYPAGKFKVFITDFLYDENNGDYDTRFISHLLTPEGETVEINRYFAEKNGVWSTIDKDEFTYRYNKYMERNSKTE